jgi:exonuclease SbcC
MIPLHLTLSGFLSYRDQIELDFSTFDLACIAGSNGAGKSSLLDAITWSLFGQARKRDDSLINTKEEVAQVSFIFSYENNIYRVLRAKPRNKTSQLEFHILSRDPQQTAEDQNWRSGTWKPLTERTLRDTEARIQETLRLDYETFVNASFFLQGKADQFTQQRPGDRKRILASILGLEIWEIYRQRAGEQRRGIDYEIQSLDGRMQEINAELSEEETRVARLEQLETELKELAETRAGQEISLENIRQITATLKEQERLVEILAGQYDEGVRDLEQEKDRLAIRVEDRSSFNDLLARSEDIEAAHSAWLETREKLAHWDQVAASFQEHEARRQEPLTEIKAVEAAMIQERHDLETKLAEIHSAQEQLPDLEKQFSDLAGILQDAEHRLARRERLQVDLQSAQQDQADARAENPRLKADMDQLKERIDQLTATEGADCPVCGQPLSQADRHNLIEKLNAEGTEMGDKFRANQHLLNQNEQKVKDLEEQIKSLTSAEQEHRQAEVTRAQLATQINQLNTSINRWETDGAPRLIALEDQISTQNYAPEARQRLSEIDAELKTIGYDAAQHDAVRKAEADGRNSGEEMLALEKARATIRPLEREISELEKKIDASEAEIARKHEQYKSAAEALRSSREQAPDQLAAEDALLKLQERENQARLEVGAAKQKVLVLDDLKKRYAILETDRLQSADQVTYFKQLERAFSKDGVPALLIEQALPQIELKANEILERLTMGDMSIRFITQAAYRDKSRDDLRETLDIQISDSAGVRDYEMFSGGEAFRINFAIRLALSEVLAQRAGARLQLLVIDEGFGSQDAQGRQRLIEAISLVRQDFAKILLITHIDELKEHFPHRIEVDKTSRGSTVRVV